jgi:hypothetical protein
MEIKFFCVCRVSENPKTNLLKTIMGGVSFYQRTTPCTPFGEMIYLCLEDYGREIPTKKKSWHQALVGPFFIVFWSKHVQYCADNTLYQAANGNYTILSCCLLSPYGEIGSGYTSMSMIVIFLSLPILRQRWRCLVYDVY